MSLVDGEVTKFTNAIGRCVSFQVVQPSAAVCFYTGYYASHATHDTKPILTALYCTQSSHVGGSPQAYGVFSDGAPRSSGSFSFLIMLSEFVV